MVGGRGTETEYCGADHGRGGEGRAAFRGKGATRGQPGLLAVPSAPIQLYFSVVNAYIVTFVNGELSEGHVDG